MLMRKMMMIPMLFICACMNAATTNIPPQAAVYDTLVPNHVEDQLDTAGMEIYTYVEQPPVFPGGEEALVKYISRNLHVKNEMLEGEWFPPTRCIEFVVDSTGKIRGKSIYGIEKEKYTKYEEHLIDLAAAMPDWTPGKQAGRRVAVLFRLPIRVCFTQE
jgi:hypothetical protein